MLWSMDEAFHVARPPASVLKLLPAWYVFVFILVINAVLRLAVHDVLGGIVLIMMLIITYVMIRDHMRNMPGFCLMFSILCVVNFIFDVIPLLSTVGGKTKTTVTPVQTVTAAGTRQTIYSETVRKTPFFDATQGFRYNLESVVMIISPVVGFIGMWLAIWTYIKIQQATDDVPEQEPLNWRVGNAQAGRRNLANYGGGVDIQQTRGNQSGVPTTGRPAATFDAFSGHGHKLGNG